MSETVHIERYRQDEREKVKSVGGRYQQWNKGKNGEERRATASEVHVIGRQLGAPDSGQAATLRFVRPSFSVKWSAHRKWCYLSLPEGQIRCCLSSLDIEGLLVMTL